MNYDVGDKIIYLQNNCRVTNKPRKCIIVAKYKTIFGNIKYDIRPIDSDVIWKGIKDWEIECKLTPETQKNYFEVIYNPNRL